MSGNNKDLKKVIKYVQSMSSNAEFFLMSETASQFFEKRKLKNEFTLLLKECPVCGNKKFKYLFKHDDFHYYKCKDCTFVFVNPRLNDKGCNIWYNSDYYNAALETEYFINREKDTYYSVSLIKKHFEKTFNILKKTRFKKDISILDLGCGGGSFLAYLHDKLGFQNVMGVDLNDKAVNFAVKYRKLNVQKIDANHLSKEQKFDLVISTENIEHVNEINAYMNNVSRLIKRNGYLLLTTPYNDKWATTFYGIHGDHYCAPNHLNYFNLNSLSFLLKKYNYKIIDIYIDDSSARFDLFTFIKSKFYTRDQVTCLPPYEAYFNKPILKFNKNRRKNVAIRPISLGTDMSNQKTLDNKRDRLIKAVKKILRYISWKLNFRFKTHIILLAQKNTN